MCVLSSRNGGIGVLPWVRSMHILIHSVAADYRHKMCYVGGFRRIYFRTLAVEKHSHAW
jgi:hypothetical protein